MSIGALYIVIALASFAFALLKHLWAWVINKLCKTISDDEKLAGDPQIVITLVHGTGARGAPWTAPNSLLRSSLSSALNNRAAYCRFLWSGTNSIRARRASATLLRQRLSELTHSFPRAQHFVVGHSHGGSIILEALDAKIAGQIAGIVCLATPVLMMRRRHFNPVAKAAIALVPVVPMVYLGMWVINRIGAEGSDAETLIGLSFMAAGLVFSWVIARWANTLHTGVDLSFLNREKIMFLRAPGDEASGTLNAAHILSWAVGKVVTWPTLAVWHAQQRAQQFIDWATKFLDHKYLAAGLISVIVFGGTVILLGGYRGPFPVAVSIAALVCALLFIVLLLISLVAYGNVFTSLPAMFFTAFLLFPLVLVGGLVGWLTIGPEMAVAALLWEVTAETTPPGNWNVELLRPKEDSSDDILTLQHSAAYQNPDALKLIGGWIRDRSASREMGANR
jgi:hypothetical protein